MVLQPLLCYLHSLAAARQRWCAIMCVQRGRTWMQSLATMFSWAKGQEVTSAQVEACFPATQMGRVLLVKVDQEVVASLGEGSCTLQRSTSWALPVGWQSDPSRVLVRTGACGAVVAMHAAPS